MDKNIRWLFRGSALIVTIFGSLYISKTLLNKLKQSNAQYEEYISSNEFERAEMRCKNFPTISYLELIKKLENEQILSYLVGGKDGSIFQVKTKGWHSNLHYNFIIRTSEIITTEDLLKILDSEQINFEWIYSFISTDDWEEEDWRRWYYDQNRSRRYFNHPDFDLVFFTKKLCLLKTG